MEDEKYYKNKDEKAEKIIAEMEAIIKDEKIEERYIRELVAMQKGELNVRSKYYSGNIVEANWSLIEKDLDIEELDKEIISIKEIEKKFVDAEDFIFGLSKTLEKEDTELPREKDAEYTYVFKPSYYAVMLLILYYIENKKSANKIYGLKNAVVRRGIDKFYGGLPFVLKYLEILLEKEECEFIKSEFTEIMEKIMDYKIALELNHINDEFINDIIDCIGESGCKDFILEKRVKDFEYRRDECFCVNFKEESQKNSEFLIHCVLVEDYIILMHRDVKKDWNHLKKEEKERAIKLINNTPKYPENVPPDNDPLKGNLKGWFSQDVSKKDRVVYRKDANKKIVYVATVCDHYKDASRRSMSTASYR